MNETEAGAMQLRIRIKSEIRTAVKAYYARYGQHDDTESNVCCALLGIAKELMDDYETT